MTGKSEQASERARERERESANERGGGGGVNGQTERKGGVGEKLGWWGG